MDVDGDGVLSMFELEFFYEEQCERMERMGIEPLPFQDLLCQMLDLVKPESPGSFSTTFGHWFNERLGLTWLFFNAVSCRQDNADRPEAMSDGSHLLRHLLQPGEIPRP